MNTAQVNDRILERFLCLVDAKRLAHAYLFVGPVGAGKTQTALAVAQLVNCESPLGRPCGQCAACRKIVSGNHPDVYVVSPDDKGSIKIEVMRYVLERTRLKPYEARVKVFLIRHVEWMEREAANAFLKTLEEPSANTVMILTTAVPEACLDTIKSRCHTVKFFCAQDHLPEDKNRILDAFLNRANHEEYLKTLSSDKQQTSEAMLVLFSWLRDVMFYKSGVDVQNLVYRDRLSSLKGMSQRGMEDLCQLNAQIIHVKSLVDENLNVKMALSLLRERVWGN